MAHALFFEVAGQPDGVVDENVLAAALAAYRAAAPGRADLVDVLGIAGDLVPDLVEADVERVDAVGRQVTVDYFVVDGKEQLVGLRRGRAEPGPGRVAVLVLGGDGREGRRNQGVVAKGVEQREDGDAARLAVGDQLAEEILADHGGQPLLVDPAAFGQRVIAAHDGRFELRKRAQWHVEVFADPPVVLDDPAAVQGDDQLVHFHRGHVVDDVLPVLKGHQVGAVAAFHEVAAGFQVGPVQDIQLGQDKLVAGQLKTLHQRRNAVTQPFKPETADGRLAVIDFQGIALRQHIAGSRQIGGRQNKLQTDAGCGGCLARLVQQQTAKGAPKQLGGFPDNRQGGVAGNFQLAIRPPGDAQEQRRTVVAGDAFGDRNDLVLREHGFALHKDDVMLIYYTI